MKEQWSSNLFLVLPSVSHGKKKGGGPEESAASKNWSEAQYQLVQWFKHDSASFELLPIKRWHQNPLLINRAGLNDWLLMSRIGQEWCYVLFRANWKSDGASTYWSFSGLTPWSPETLQVKTIRDDHIEMELERAIWVFSRPDSSPSCRLIVTTERSQVRTSQLSPVNTQTIWNNNNKWFRWFYTKFGVLLHINRELWMIKNLKAETSSFTTMTLTWWI